MTVKVRNAMECPSDGLVKIDLDSFYALKNTEIHPSVIDFIATHNGGTPLNALFDYTDLEGKTTSGDVLEFLPLCRTDNDDVLHVTERFHKEGRIGAEFLVIARESGGHLILVEKKTGHVFLWDHEEEASYPRNCYLLANSLLDFFNDKLHSIPV